MNGRNASARRPADPAPARRPGGNGGHWGLEDDIERHRANIDQTLSELESRFTPGELIEQGLKHLGAGTGDFLQSFRNAATTNPVPMALVGVGLTWMMLNGDHGEHPRQDSGAGESDEPAIDRDIPDLEDFRDVYLFCLQQEHPFDPDQLECILYDDLGPEALIGYRPDPSIYGAGGDWAGRWGNLGADDTSQESGLGERAKEAGQKARDEALSRIYKTSSRMAEGTAEARERLDRARADAWRRAKRAQAAVDRKAREAKRRVSDIVDRYPLSIVALGVAAGAAIGGTLPSTSAEDRLMGAQSDALKARGKEEAHHQLDQAKEMTAAAAIAAKEEAEAQGLDPQHARETAHALRNKAGRVVTSADEERRHEGVTGESAGEQVHSLREKAERVASAARDAAREQRGAR